MDYHFEKVQGLLVLYCYEDMFHIYNKKLTDRGYFKLRNEQIPLLIQANFIRDFGEQRDYSGTYCKYEEILDWEFDMIRDRENIVYNSI